jgi:hypothetical protein
VSSGALPDAFRERVIDPGQGEHAERSDEGRDLTLPFVREVGALVTPRRPLAARPELCRDVLETAEYR